MRRQHLARRWLHLEADEFGDCGLEDKVRHGRIQVVPEPRQDGGGSIGLFSASEHDLQAVLVVGEHLVCLLRHGRRRRRRGATEDVAEQAEVCRAASCRSRGSGGCGRGRGARVEEVEEVASTAAASHQRCARGRCCGLRRCCSRRAVIEEVVEVEEVLRGRGGADARPRPAPRRGVDLVDGRVTNVTALRPSDLALRDGHAVEDARTTPIPLVLKQLQELARALLQVDVQAALKPSQSLADALELPGATSHELDQRRRNEGVRRGSLVCIRGFAGDVHQQVKDVPGCDVDRLIVRADGAARDEVVAELTEAPDADVDEGLLREALFHVEVQLDDCVGVQLRGRGHHTAKLFPHGFLHVIPTKTHNLDERVQLPTTVRRVLVHSHTNLAAQLLFEVSVGHQEIVQELLRHVLDVLLVDERVGHVQCALPDRDVGVLETFDDRRTVPLHSLRVDVHHALKCRERHVADVVVTAEEEAAQDVNPEHSEAAFGLNGHDRQNALVEDGIACVFRTLGVGCDLGEDVVHLIACTDRLRAEEAQ
mmetsp:Transcript_145548/g.362954  ORF Transcript_145548/g.362954 Transcript_145548/m.362954 type:complete len:538 (+) Transcript_145548:600-2213(+)